MGLLLASQLVEIVNQHLYLGGRGPVLHFDTIDDRTLLHVFFILLDIRLIEVDGQRDMTSRAIWRLVFERSYVVLCAFPAELMMAARTNRFFSSFIADTTNQDVLSTLRVLL